MKEFRWDNERPSFSLTDLAFLQEMRNELLRSILPIFIPDNTNAAILNGCEITADTGLIYVSTQTGVSWAPGDDAGTVIYNGKLYRVKAGQVTGSYSEPFANAVGLKIVQDPDFDTGTYRDVLHADGSRYPVYYDDVMILVDSGWDVGFNQLRYVSHKDPVGTIKMFNGSGAVDYWFADNGKGIGIWKGWAVADGRNGTVDMRGCVPVGYGATGDGNANWVAGYDTPGTVVGANSVELSDAQVPLRDHTHTATQEPHSHRPSITGADFNLVNNPGGGFSWNTGGSGNVGGNASTTEEKTPAITVDNASAARTEAVDIRQPSIVTVFIQKI